MILPALSLSVSALPSVREEPVLSLLPLKLLCSAAKLYQQGILLLHFTPPPSNPLFQGFCRLWLCKRSWNPFGLRHFVPSCWETNAAAQGSCWRKKVPLKPYLNHRHFVKGFTVFLCPVPGMYPCHTVHAACTWSSCSGIVIHSKKKEKFCDLLRKRWEDLLDVSRGDWDTRL